MAASPETANSSLTARPSYFDELLVANEYSDRRLQALLDHAPIGIHWVDAEGVIIWANQTELEMLGYAADEYIGRPIADFHVDASVIGDIFARLKGGESVHGREAQLRHKDGSIRVCAIDSNVLWDRGEFVHTQCFTREIGNEKRLEAIARAKFHELENIYRTAPVGLALVDREFRFVRINERLAQINGLTSEEHIGRTFREVVPAISAQAEAVCAQVLVSGEAVLDIEFEGETAAQPGIKRAWNESWYPIKDADGRTISVNVVVEEITERKRAEAALAESARITTALFNLTDSLQRARSLEDTHSAALSAIIDALHCNRASILLYDSTGTMRFVGWRGLSEGYRKAVEGHSPWSPTDTEPQPITIDDVAAADLPAELKATVLGEGIHACAFIPLVAGGRLIGKFMSYFDAPHVFRKEETDLCLSIARQLAFGIEHKRAEQSLRARERQFREMIDALPAAIYTTDANGRLTHFNPAAIQFSGRVPELGTDLWCVTWKLYHADGTPMPHEACPMAVALQEGKSVRNVEAIAELPDGTRRWFIPYPTPLRDDAGRIVGAINMLVDITERKAAESVVRNHAKKLALIADTAPVFIAHCDRDARYKFVNKSYAERLGLRVEDCVGRTVRELLGPKVYESLLPYIAMVLEGQAVQFEIDVPYLNNGEHFMHCSYAPERDASGKVIGWVAAVTDITERKRIEQALRASEEKLKETDRRKDEFLAMLAHELRNPLAPIANAVHLLHHERSESPMLQQARAIIDRQTGRLARLVDDLLEVSRITTGRIRLHMETVGIAGVVERAVETVRPLIEQHRHVLEVALPPEPLWLYADAARLEQVIVNLLTNAAKYTDDGGQIRLRVQHLDREVLMTVSDTGIGISPDLLPHVFDLFTQSERSLDRAHGGLGIGLSLVQRIVSMHGGTVVAASNLGEGSEFTVRLPIAPAPTATVKPSRDAGTADAPYSMRVLVVDDNVDAARSLAMLLEVSGHVVWTAHDGLAAIDAAIEYRPHVIILDIGLPKLDGYAVARRLREHAQLQGIVLVAMTGYGQAADREQALLAGFDRHLVKPVDFEQVESILEEASKAHAR